MKTNNPVGGLHNTNGVTPLQFDRILLNKEVTARSLAFPGCFFSIAHFPTSDPKEQKIPADAGRYKKAAAHSVAAKDA